MFVGEVPIRDMKVLEIPGPASPLSIAPTVSFVRTTPLLDFWMACNILELYKKVKDVDSKNCART